MFDRTKLMSGAGPAMLALCGALMLAPAEARADCGSSHRVVPGDTLAAIAARCDTTVDELVSANDRISDPSHIGVGWILAIPAATDGEPQGIARDDGEAFMRVEGRLGPGVECPTLETPDGEIYALTGADTSTLDGGYVEVTGTMAQMSFCMQGEGTIQVAEVRETEPPARDRDPARTGGVALDHDYVLGAWTAKGGDCGTPDFVIEANSAGGQVVDARFSDRDQTGYVRLGPDPAFVFDHPQRELPLETRGPDGIAVMPPQTGAVALGDEEIAGDGVVFIRCG